MAIPGLTVFVLSRNLYEKPIKQSAAMLKQEHKSAVRNKSLTFALAFFLSVAVAGFGSLDFASAQTVMVQDPQNKVYSENAVPLVFSYVTPTHPYAQVSIGGFSYRLDGEPEFSFNPSSNGSSYKTTINGLTDGNHTLIVHVQTIVTSLVGPGPQTVFWQRSDSIEFAVNTAAPKIQLISTNPTKLETYNGTSVPLVFSVNEVTSWMGYSVDNNKLVTVSGNVTLTGLSEGLHSLVVYANDTWGSMGKSSAAYFKTVLPEIQPTSTPSPSPTPSPTLLVSPSPSLQPTLEPTQTPNPTTDTGPATDANPAIVLGSVIAAASIAVAALVYFRRRRQP